MRFTISSLIALAAAIVSVAQSTPEISTNALLTNAKRFAAGLPPLPPKSLYRSFPHGGSKVGTARRAGSSPSVPISINCNVLVADISTGLPLGFIGPVWGSNGVYNQLQSGQAGSLEVKITYTADSLGQLDLVSTGALTSAYPYIGASPPTASSSSIGPGIDRSLYVTGIASGTPKGSSPVRLGGGNAYGSLSMVPGPAESSIWKYNPGTRVITAQWVNPGGTLPATYLAYAADKRGLMITGDMAKLKATTPSPVEVTLTCVPPPPTVLSG